MRLWPDEDQPWSGLVGIDFLVGMVAAVAILWAWFLIQLVLIPTSRYLGWS